MKTDNATLYQTHDEWLQARTLGIGASEAAAARGASMFGGPMTVYANKKNPEEHKSSEAIKAGHLLEETVARKHADATGDAVHQPTEYLGDEFAFAAVWHDTDRPFILATPDRICTSEDRGIYLLEIKTVGERMAYHWKSGPPLEVRIQCQQQMHVLDVPDMDIRAMMLSDDARKIALGLAENSIRAGASIANALSDLMEEVETVSYTVERDDDYLLEHVEALADLWQRIKDGSPPDPSDTENAAALLNRVWPEEDPNRKVELAENYGHLVAELYQAADARKAAEKREDAAKVAVKSIMGDAIEATYGGQKVATWKERVTNYKAKEAFTTRTRRFEVARKRVVLSEADQHPLPEEMTL